MSTTNHSTQTTGTTGSTQHLQNAAAMIEHFLTEVVSELERGRELLDIDVKTKVMSDLEGVLNDPLTSLMRTSNNIDAQLKRLFDIYAVKFLKAHTDVIAAAYKSVTNDNTLWYGIVLKDDNIENRDIVYSFFDSFPFNEIQERCPIIFQITPPVLVDKILNRQDLNLA